MLSPGSKGPDGLRRWPRIRSPKLLGDDALAELLVGEVEIPRENCRRKEVPEGTVADVGQEPDIRSTSSE